MGQENWLFLIIRVRFFLLTDQHRKEAFSRAYLRAIASKAGVNLSHEDFDYGMDLGIAEIKRRDIGGVARYVSGMEFRVQLKCTHTITTDQETGELIYDLESKNYNDLVDTDINLPRILVIVHVPQNEGDWVNLDQETLVMQHCAYWKSFRGQQPTNNLSTIRIRIPGTNIFNHEAINRIIAMIRAGEEL